MRLSITYNGKLKVFFAKYETKDRQGIVVAKSILEIDTYIKRELSR